MILTRNVTHLAVLDSLVHKVLANVDMLRPLSPTDYVVTPLDACDVVLVHLGVGNSRVRAQNSEFPESHVLEQVSEV